MRPTTPVPAYDPGGETGPSFDEWPQMPIAARSICLARGMGGDTRPEGLSARVRTSRRARTGHARGPSRPPATPGRAQANANAESAGRKTRPSPHPLAVPRRLVDWGALVGRNLSKDAIYILSLVDGSSSVEAIIDASAIAPAVAYEALSGLLSAEIVGLDT